MLLGGSDKFERVSKERNDGIYLLGGELELGARQNIFRFMQHVIGYEVGQSASRSQEKNLTCMSAKQNAGNENIRIADNLHEALDLRRTLRMARFTSASVSPSPRVMVSPSVKTASHCR